MRWGILLGLLISAASAAPAWATDPRPIFVDQGPGWTQQIRADFYSRDQGARMIPLEWLRALKQPSGQMFLADSLARYGYLPNPDDSNGLPVGFTASGPAGVQIAGMTCSACHTRQIAAEGRTYRIDGGPAIVDFQSFLSDLDGAVGQILASDAAFRPFAAAVLGSAVPDSDDITALRRRVDAWYLRYHTLMTRALPHDAPWGLGRLDAVGMIFNRLAGLDVGAPPSRLIPDNIRRADAPTRYPFLWNAPMQDKIQWTGFMENGGDVLALARNLGQVIGVFGVFEPRREGFFFDFLNNNSANFDGLGRIEGLLRKLGPPKWPWPVDAGLAAQGKSIYERPTAQGGCNECHGTRPGKVRFPNVQTWATPIRDVGTDTREYDTLAWTAQTGVLEGASIPFVTRPLQQTDLVFSMLAISVLGSITQQVLTNGGDLLGAQVQSDRYGPGPSPYPQLGPMPLPPSLKDLEAAFHAPAQLLDDLTSTAAAPKGAYEARVLEGIWAAAPYLHNGSVPTLAELLKPASERVETFSVGPAYDTADVGLAAEQTQFNYSLKTTGCEARNSGNSRCGHEFGTGLSAQEKKALLEYLKTL